ncbi:MAG: putative pit accessory protein [bacterium ADurb.Bin429]|nr:MAG: putative pit accessory protein [bacterium ADurb.Bin429]
MAKLRLIPRDERFFDLFEQATDIAVAGADALQCMLSDICRAEECRKQIADIEHAGDSVIHDVMDKLNRTFVTPLDPEDIRAIASRLDDIIDFTQAAAERVVLYDVTTAHTGASELVKVLQQTVLEVKKVVALLRDLGGQRKAILEHCIEINRLENAGDRIYREALGKLFRAGDLLELLRWKEIFEQIEQAIDQCEDLADVIESVVVKHA